MTDGLFAVVGIQPQRPDPARDHQPDVAVAHVVAAAGGQHRLHHFLRRHRDGQQDGLGRTKEPVNVFGQFEHAPVVGADALENSVAIKQSVVQHRNPGVFLVVVFSVNVNLHGFQWHPEPRRNPPRILNSPKSGVKFNLGRPPAAAARGSLARVSWMVFSMASGLGETALRASRSTSNCLRSFCSPSARTNPSRISTRALGGGFRPAASCFFHFCSASPQTNCGPTRGFFLL